MSAKNAGVGSPLGPASSETRGTLLTLDAQQARIRRNGIEFWSSSSLPAWTEMTVDLEAQPGQLKVRCNGVVVACRGNRHEGYRVSLLFTGLSRQAQERLSLLA